MDRDETNNTATTETELVAREELALFSDGFEAGDISAWTLATGSATLGLAEARGTYTVTWVPDQRALQELGSGPGKVLIGRSASGRELFALELRRLHDLVERRLVAGSEGARLDSAWAPMGDPGAVLRLEWSAAGPRGGWLGVSVDGESLPRLSGLAGGGERLQKLELVTVAGRSILSGPAMLRGDDSGGLE